MSYDTVCQQLRGNESLETHHLAIVGHVHRINIFCVVVTTIDTEQAATNPNTTVHVQVCGVFDSTVPSILLYARSRLTSTGDSNGDILSTGHYESLQTNGVGMWTSEHDTVRLYVMHIPKSC